LVTLLPIRPSTTTAQRDDTSPPRASTPRGWLERRAASRIVTIASIAGKEGNPNVAAYSASEAGVIALTKSAGKVLARTGVRGTRSARRVTRIGRAGY